jgi:hypothetical protein
MQFLKNTKYKKIRTQNFKNTNPKFQKYKIQKIKFKMSQRANPMSILKSKNQLAK